MKNKLILILIFFNFNLIFSNNELNERFLKACLDGREEIVVDLIKKGANVNYLKRKGELYTTPLISAIANNNKNSVKIVQILINNNAQVNLLLPDKWNALTTAVYWGKLDVVKLLLKYKVKLDQETFEGYTALSLAKQQGYKEIVKLLIEAGAKK